MDIAEWLESLGLAQYAPAFAENAIDWAILPKLTADDLKEIGVVAVGHRRRLLEAITSASNPPSAAPVPQSPAASAAEAERRQLTTMFCDLVGSTALASRFDPEDLREVIGTYHSCVADTVGRFDGFVAKYMGDGVLIYFGYPQAHEDDAERAVSAGIAVIDAIARLDLPERLSVRLGIASGLVVVGDLIGEGAAQERGVVGESPNLAARLQSLADPNTVIIADPTRRQLGGLFEVEDLGLQTLVGFTEPQRAWRVIRESGMLSRFEALRSGATPLVGRGEEIELLLRRWAQAKTGEGRVVLISGEPGIGKSRLTAALADGIAAEVHTGLRYFCSPHHQDTALYPFIAQLERAAGLGRDDSPEQKRAKLDSLLFAGARDQDEITLIAELLSLPNDAATLNFSPQRKREILLHGLLHQLERAAAREPVLMVFEDAHWIDPTSRELIDLTIDRVRRCPILLVITFRPEFQPLWAGQPYVTTLMLNRLGHRDGSALVAKLAAGAQVSSELIREIVDRTDGVPLFLEELTKALLESGDRQSSMLAATPRPSLAIPATLHASLIARLDRLGPAAKEVAQIGAVLGREFEYELIQRVASRPDLNAALGHLTDAGLLFRRGALPHASYLFKHALVQDAAYSTLLRSRRQELHARVAAALEQHFAELVERQPELLAYHLTGAAEAKRAVSQWSKAGQRALQRSAHQEAVNHFRRGLSVLNELEPSVERAKQELDIQINLAAALHLGQGQSAPELVDAYERARQISEEIDDAPQLFKALMGLYRFYGGRTEIDIAAGVVERLYQLARRRQDPELLVEANTAYGTMQLIWGDLDTAQKYLEEAIAQYDSQRCSRQFSLDPGVVSSSRLSWTLWLRGYADRALEASEATLALAGRLGSVQSLAVALWNGALFHQFRREPQLVRDLSRAGSALSAKHRLPELAARSGFLLGWVTCQQGRCDEGIQQMRDNLAEFQRIGGAFLPWYIILLAEAISRTGNIDEAFALVQQVEKVTPTRIRESHIPIHTAELYRLKSELLIAKQDQTQAEQYLLFSLEVARRQGARALQLRAATNLAQLWSKKERRAEAHELLAPVYGWFTEGFDTADLTEAKALLFELAQSNERQRTMLGSGCRKDGNESRAAAPSGCPLP